MAIITGVDEELGFSFKNLAKEFGGQVALTTTGFAANKLQNVASSASPQPRPAAGLSPAAKSGLMIGAGVLGIVFIATKVLGQRPARSNPRRRRRRGRR